MAAMPVFIIRVFHVNHTMRLAPAALIDASVAGGKARKAGKSHD